MSDEDRELVDIAIGGNPANDILIDKVLDPEEVGRNLWSTIEKMSPFGEANPKPLFILKSVLLHEVKQFGKKKEHVELVLRNALTDGQTRAIKFFAADEEKFMKKLEPGASLDIVAHMEKSMFKNYPEYRLRIVDIL